LSYLTLWAQRSSSRTQLPGGPIAWRQRTTASGSGALSYLIGPAVVTWLEIRWPHGGFWFSGPTPRRYSQPRAGRSATKCERSRGLSALAGTPIADSALAAFGESAVAERHRTPQLWRCFSFGVWPGDSRQSPGALLPDELAFLHRRRLGCSAGCTSHQMLRCPARHKDASRRWRRPLTRETVAAGHIRPCAWWGRCACSRHGSRGGHQRGRLLVVIAGLLPGRISHVAWSVLRC
jgi:hypothetical protein